MKPCGTKSHPNAETILFTISKDDKELNESSSHVHCKFSVTAGMKSPKLVHAKYAQRCSGLSMSWGLTFQIYAMLSIQSLVKCTLKYSLIKRQFKIIYSFHLTHNFYLYNNCITLTCMKRSIYTKPGYTYSLQETAYKKLNSLTLKVNSPKS